MRFINTRIILYVSVLLVAVEAARYYLSHPEVNRVVRLLVDGSTQRPGVSKHVVEWL